MTCELCGGAGWRPVDDGYALRMAPELTLEEVAHLDGPATEAAERERERLRRAHARSVYPCSRCLPALYDRWIDGHLEPDHRHEGCAVCEAVDETTGKRRPRRRAAAAVSAGVSSTPDIPDPEEYQGQF